MRPIERGSAAIWWSSHSCHTRSRTSASILQPELSFNLSCALSTQCRQSPFSYPTPRAFARGLPFRRLCRLLVTVDGPHLPSLATATRFHADHSVTHRGQWPLHPPICSRVSFVGAALAMSAKPLPLAGNDLASRMDDATPGFVNAAPRLQQTASALTHRDYPRRRQLTALQAQCCA